MNQIRIESLQSLRALAFLSVFMTHFFNKPYYTALSLSIFFILSGFILSIKYINLNEKINLKQSFLFALKRLEKLYILHIITMLVDIVLYIETFKHSGINFHVLIKFLFQIVANIFLIQSWIPISDINVSLNGVAWFLSVMVFLYSSFPLINKTLKNKTTNYYKVLVVSLALLLLLLTNVSALIIDDTTYLYGWFIFRNPITRLIDFTIGYCLGRMFTEQKDINYNFLTVTFIEIFLTLFCIYIYKFSNTYYLNLPFAKNRTAYYYVLSSLLWVYMFANRKGLITKLLSNKLFNWIGDLSGYAFLIHFPIIQWTSFYISIGIFNPSNIEKYALLVLELFLTILLSYLWCLLNNKVFSQDKNMNKKLISIIKTLHV